MKIFYFSILYFYIPLSLAGTTAVGLVNNSKANPSDIGFVQVYHSTNGSYYLRPCKTGQVLNGNAVCEVAGIQLKRELHDEDHTIESSEVKLGSVKFKDRADFKQAIESAILSYIDKPANSNAQKRINSCLQASSYKKTIDELKKQRIFNPDSNPNQVENEILRLEALILSDKKWYDEQVQTILREVESPITTYNTWKPKLDIWQYKVLNSIYEKNAPQTLKKADYFKLLQWEALKGCSITKKEVIQVQEEKRFLVIGNITEPEVWTTYYEIKGPSVFSTIEGCFSPTDYPKTASLFDKAINEAKKKGLTNIYHLSNCEDLLESMINQKECLVDFPKLLLKINEQEDKHQCEKKEN
ncbi:MAG: hypothetical protein ACOYL6_18180 [Bacteriovoracaceae bacterium]